MAAPTTVIAILDDEAKMRQALKRLLEANDFEVELFATGASFIDAALCKRPDCVLLDLHMPTMSGFQVLEGLNACGLHLPVIVVTGHDEPGNASRVIELGAADYLLKPIRETTILDAIHRACSHHTDPA